MNSTVGGGGTSKVHWGSSKTLQGGGRLLEAGIRVNYGGARKRRMPRPLDDPVIGKSGADADADGGGGAGRRLLTALCSLYRLVTRHGGVYGDNGCVKGTIRRISASVSADGMLLDTYVSMAASAEGDMGCDESDCLLSVVSKSVFRSSTSSSKFTTISGTMPKSSTPPSMLSSSMGWLIWHYG